MSSVLNVDTIADKAGTGPVGLTKQIAPKHFCNYDTDSSTAVRGSGSFNNASLTDNGTGDTTLSLTNNMDSVNYSTLCQSGDAATSDGSHVIITVVDATTTRTSGLFRAHCTLVNSASNRTSIDRDINDASTLGDLA